LFNNFTICFIKGAIDKIPPSTAIATLLLYDEQKLLLIKQLFHLKITFLAKF